MSDDENKKFDVWILELFGRHLPPLLIKRSLPYRLVSGRRIGPKPVGRSVGLGGMCAGAALTRSDSIDPR